MLDCGWTPATIEVHHLCSEIHHFRSLRPLPKTDVEEIKLLPDETFHGLGTRRESCKEITWFGRFSV